MSSHAPSNRGLAPVPGRVATKGRYSCFSLPGTLWPSLRPLGLTLGPKVGCPTERVSGVERFVYLHTPQLQLAVQGGHYETFYQDHAYVVDWFLYGYYCKCKIGL